MKHYQYISTLLLCICTLVSCQKKYCAPTSFKSTNEKVKIFPNYTDAVIPPNIAPLNFKVLSEGDRFVVTIKCGDKELSAGCGSERIIKFDSTMWRNQITACRGKSMKVTLYAERKSEWFALKSYNLAVAEEPIDPYLTYRLIEPGYELYRQLGIYQRNMTNFDVHTIYENNRKYNKEQNHCINCHNYKNNDAGTFLFHVRGKMGGTLIAKNGTVEKMNMKNDSLSSGAAYPAWHPTKNWIVFASIKTGQVFHLYHKEKLEVLDMSSDLIFYNADTKQISNVLKTRTDLETFPAWSPKGDRLFYAVAHMPSFATLPDSLHTKEVVAHYNKMHYNLMSMPFDERTQTFGEPILEFDAAKLGKSATQPRISPDGRYILFVMADYGHFPHCHVSSDLYVKDLKTQEVYPLKAANSKASDSFHSWSSNSRWFVFSSKRFDLFTRTYIAYFDKNGKAHKAFMLPQEDPEQNLMLFKTYNIPELTRNAIPFSTEQFREAIYEQEDATPVTYKEIRKECFQRK